MTEAGGKSISELRERAVKEKNAFVRVFLFLFFAWEACNGCQIGEKKPPPPLYFIGFIWRMGIIKHNRAFEIEMFIFKKGAGTSGTASSTA